MKVIAAMMELPRLRLAGSAPIRTTPTAAIPRTPNGSSRASRRWSTSWRRAGSRCPRVLFAASPFVLKFPQTYLNAVDPGRMLYGITFPGETSPLPLRPTLRALKLAGHRAQGADARASASPRRRRFR